MHGTINPSDLPPPSQKRLRLLINGVQKYHNVPENWKQFVRECALAEHLGGLVGGERIRAMQEFWQQTFEWREDEHGLQTDANQLPAETR